MSKMRNKLSGPFLLFTTLRPFVAETLPTPHTRFSSLSFIFHVNDQCDHAGNVHIVNNVGGGGSDHRVHTEWQLPLSGVHSIMMVKSAHPDEGGGCTPFPFYCIYHHQAGVYALAERADTLPLFLLYP